LGGILALALSLTGCASAVDGAGVVGNESSSPAGGATVTVASPGFVPGASKGQFGGPSNLIVNGSFEHGTYPWQNFTGSRLAVTPSVHRFGRFALLVRPQRKPPRAVGAAIVDLVSQPAPGSRYSFSTWVKAPPHGGLVQVELSTIRGRDKTWTQVAAESRRVDGRWQHLLVRGTVRIHNAAALRVTVSLNDFAPDDGLAIDGVEAKTLAPGSGQPVG
jgi:hypothetical protein